jgi:Ca-activated chloride channel family protein
MRIRFTLALSVALAFLLLTAFTAHAQNPTLPQDQPPVMPRPTPKPTPPPRDDEYDVVRVSSNLVVVPVSVTEASGQPVLGLKASDFRLEEEGRTQEIAEIGNPEQVPLSIAILLDVSLSVEARIDFEKEAAARFLKQVMKTGDRATVFTISTDPRLEQPLDTSERTAAKMASIKLAERAKGATAFYDTVVEAARYLAQKTPTGHRRVIVVISDGEDTYSERIKAAIGTTPQERDSIKLEDRLKIHNRVVLEVQREVQKAEVAFYSINPSGEALRLNVISKRAQAGMEQLSNATGGTSFVPEKLENLDAVFHRITAELRSQYLLQYYSNNDSPGNKFLRIKVTTPARADLRIRAREGYYPKRSK